MMVNTGVAITLLTKKWADGHGLTMKEKVAEYISGTNSTVVKIVGMTSMTLLLAPTLEIDMANVVICLGNFYQGLLGCDLLFGYNEASVQPLSLCPGRTNQVLLVGHRRRWAVLRLPKWSHNSPLRQ